VRWSLEGLHWVDFRATSSQPLKRLIWIITGEKPAELSHVPFSEEPATMRDAVKLQLLPRRDQYTPAYSALEVSKARVYPPLVKPPDPEQATQLEILRRRVKEYWVDGVLRHSLYNEVLISLGMRHTDEFVDAPWKYTVELSDSVGSGPLVDRDVNAVYDATGLLLILGEPGSGKSTTLLDLARTLLDRAGKDIRERVPVVLNLSSWNKQPLVEWMSSELSEKYRVPRKIARSWLQQDYLLPLLDGLDEVETSVRQNCVATINEFIEKCNPSGLVVCCRLNEYRWLPERLKLNGAICLEPLSPQEVKRYLDRGGSKLAALREAVGTDPVSRELAQTPLMLNIMSLAYQGAGANQLTMYQGDSPEERRKQIFRLYVEQMFQRKGASSLVFPKEKTIDRLSWLAGKMREHSQSVFLVEGLQPSWLGTKARRAAYGNIVALSLGLMVAVSSVLVVGLTEWLSGKSIGLSAALIGVVGIDGLSILLGIALGCWWESPLKNGVMSGSIVGSFGGLMGGLIYGLSGGLNEGLSNGLIGGAIGGLGLRSLNHITLVETISWKWNQFWKRTIPGLIVGLIGLSAGLVYGLGVWLSEGRTFGLMAVCRAGQWFGRWI
jgi:hypothetical protein